MKIELIRVTAVANATIGKLYIDGVDTCYTLEDRVRPDGEKVYGQTAIPTGRYRVDVTMSARFKKMLPILLDVPNFSGIRIHAGNTVADTHGCPLVGMEQAGQTITRSREAMGIVLPAIQAALRRGEEVWIEITNKIEVAT